MNYIDEYRNPAIAEALLSRIHHRAQDLNREIALMEVCGSHTTAIGRFGIRTLLPRSIRLLSGPGCPVCVTSIGDVDRVLFLASQRGVIFTTFGDMLRVPGTGGKNLQTLRASGADVRILSSATEAVDIAKENPQRRVIFMGIGFETTAPTIALVLQACKTQQIDNLSLYSVHKTIPPAMKILISDISLKIDGFLCPGHVSTVIGAEAYRFIADAGRAAVITGFEPVDILEGILMILEQLTGGSADVEIQYSRGVNKEGNRRALEAIKDVFSPGAATWRGLGEIPESGLFLRDSYRAFDALDHFDIPPLDSEEPKGCRCGDILRGMIAPDQCPLFSRLCNPAHPIGPCMVSSEGTCAAYYKYRDGR